MSDRYAERLAARRNAALNRQARATASHANATARQADAIERLIAVVERLEARLDGGAVPEREEPHGG